VRRRRAKFKETANEKAFQTSSGSLSDEFIKSEVGPERWNKSWRGSRRGFPGGCIMVVLFSPFPDAALFNAVYGFIVRTT